MKRKMITYENIFNEWVATDGIFYGFGFTEKEAVKEYKRRRKEANNQ